MSKLRAFLEKAYLIEPEKEDEAIDIVADEIPSNLDKYLTPSEEQAQLDVVPVGGGEKVQVGIPFEEIYKLFGVKETVFPIEKLQKLLDGLKAMTPEMQKAAILAMDAADETWTLDDIIKDGQTKIQSLESFKQVKENELKVLFQDTEKQILELTKKNEEEVAVIRQQIADLQKKLDENVTFTEQSVLQLQSVLEEEKVVHAKEIMRVDSQVSALQKILTQVSV